MVSGTNDDCSSLVTGHTLSTVVPANVTGDVLLELTGVDLALKLHYLRSVYYFKPSETIERLTIWQLKEPMFLMLDVYNKAAGRIRKHESGRPHIKCNDSGVRTVEARCEKTMEEWLETEKHDRSNLLVYDKVIGPDLSFSPLVYIQYTRFKCGGLAVGMSWAHVLGDAVSASNSMNLWAHLVGNSQPAAKTQHQQKPDNNITSPVTVKPRSVKRVEANPRSVKKVEPVGDLWLTASKVRMATYSFQISESKLKYLQSKISAHIPAFEAISALIWQILAKFRVETGPNLVTVIRNDTSKEREHILGNKQIISTVATDSSVSKLELSELATLISNNKKDEKEAIDELVEKESGKEDFIVYGANLTFVDMQGIELYGSAIKGQKPARVDYSIHGVGEEGAVLVLPAGPDDAEKGGRVITAILPEDEIPKLKEVLGTEWSIA